MDTIADLSAWGGQLWALLLAMFAVIGAYAVFTLVGFGSALLASSPLALLMPVARVIPLLALLEAELGFPLFLREARGVSLTPAGERYRDRVAGVEQLLAAAAEEGGQLARGESGVLRLLHSSSIPAQSLLPAIGQFLERCPAARIELDRIASPRMFALVDADGSLLRVIDNRDAGEPG